MTDIAELFARDPLKLTKDDIEKIVTYYRSCRAQFNLGNLQAGSAKPKKEPKAAAPGLDLGLELDLS